MVHVAIEIQSLFGLHDAEPEELVFREIEGLHELSTIGIQLRFLQVNRLQPQFLAFVYQLLHSGIVRPEMYKQLRVVSYHLFYCRAQFLRTDALR